MAIKSQVAELLNKKMDRQDFLKHVGIGIVAVSGLGTALRLLAPKSSASSPSVGATGYGGSAYGGSNELPKNRKLS